MRPGENLVGETLVEHDVGLALGLPGNGEARTGQFVTETLAALVHQDGAMLVNAAVGAERGGEELHHERADQRRRQHLQRRDHRPRDRRIGRDALQEDALRRYEADVRGRLCGQVLARLNFRTDGAAPPDGRRRRSSGCRPRCRRPSSSCTRASARDYRRCRRKPARRRRVPGAQLARSPFCASTPTTRPSSLSIAQQPRVEADIDADARAVARQIEDIAARGRHHLMHARDAVRRLRQRPEEIDADAAQRFHRLGHVFGEHLAQRRIVVDAHRRGGCRRGPWHAARANRQCPRASAARCPRP